MWPFLLTGMVILSCMCNTNQKVNAPAATDTILLCKKDTPINITNIPAIVPVKFLKSARILYDSSRTTLLLLENPIVVAAAEGVYELYITTEPPNINQLSSSQPGFITVLDLYSLSAPAARKHIKVDISEAIEKIFASTQNLSFYLSIRFGGIKSSGGVTSTRAGDLRCNAITIIQVTEKK